MLLPGPLLQPRWVRGCEPYDHEAAEKRAGSAKQAAKTFRTRNGRQAADNAVPRCRGHHAGMPAAPGSRWVAWPRRVSRRGLAVPRGPARGPAVVSYPQ